ncbi:probable protein phosphatase 2C 67 [Phalaenopsis equestris]|uniref:probable protein phosphatase 2C 67 n=1 Tax=Phalaenopsis equestris TaxID=78828 RepID=UPI0009E355EF|nr:probable protein phosphatase 2C 67 [Phalaenopsis equestris]XP_020577427.1 probable protein phosphatase 2C 67 [Phalaenopsis equestris]
MLKSLSDIMHEDDFMDEHFIAKRIKVTDVAAGNLEKEKKGEKNLNIHAVDGSVSKPTLSIGQTGRSDGEKPYGGNDKQMPDSKKTSQDAISCSSKEVHGQFVDNLCKIDAAAAEDKGSRHAMEDAWVVLPDASFEYPGRLRCAHFAIYDGHGGRLAVEYARKHLHANVLSAGLPRELMDVKAAKKAILEGFRRTDESLLEESSRGNWQDGATAVCAWILGQTVLVANIGDAKAVLARAISDDTDLKSIVLTREHKAFYPQERARIQKAGGTVGANGRLQGRIEVSRAFGDRHFKKVGVIASPDVHSFELTEREHFIILGCDGLWGVFGPSDAVDFVQEQLKETSSAAAAARRLVREAIRERHCKDNCTAIVIVFKHK